MSDDEDKHEEQESEGSVLGSSPSEPVENLNDLVEGVGIRPDTDQGPKELNSLQDLESNKDEQ